MPAYDYGCPACGHTLTEHHSMFEGMPLPCPQCGNRMRKRFTSMPSVNWGGLPPHKADEIGPAARALVANADRNRDDYLAKKEARGE